MMSSRLLPSVLCNDVQSEILLMTYSVNISTGYVVSLAVCTLHGNYYKLNTVNISVIFLNLTCYTFTHHLIRDP